MRTIITVLTIIIAVLLGGALRADLETIGMKMGLDVLSRPNELFMEINSDIENTGPDPFNRKLQINFSLLWNLIGVGNMQVKYRVYGGTELLPEVTSGCSAWYIWGLHFLPVDQYSASALGYTPFITFSRRYEEKTRLFAGAKYAIGNINFEMKKSEEEGNSTEAGDFGLDFSSIDKIDSAYGEFGFYTGINYQRKSGKEVVVLVGYYPMIKKLYSKLQVASGIFDYGMSLYPDSFLLMHFYINIHINLL